MHTAFTMAERSKVIYSAKILTVIGSHNVETETDAVDINNVSITVSTETDAVDINNVSLTVSKVIIEKRQHDLNLQKTTRYVLNEDIPLITTSSGHYAIQKANQMINNLL